MKAPETAPEDLRIFVANDGRVTGSHIGLMLLLAALIVGARWIMLSRFGSDTPYWDQWDSEIAALYKPFVEGNFGIGQWLAPHNEHRIFFSRLFNLGLFWANNYQFDNQVESFANTILYTLVVLGFAWPVLKRLEGPSLLLGGVVVLCAACLPYGWENIVSGFQNAFFFMNGLAVLCLAIGAFGKTDKAIYAAAFLCFLSLFTLASGLLVAAALAFMFGLRRYCDDLPRRSAWLAIAASLAIGATGLALLTPVSGHAGLKAQGVLDLLGALLCTASWPLPPNFFSVVATWWPAAMMLTKVVRNRRAESIDIYLLGICAWALLQASAVAWSRGHEMVIASSRYTDTLVLGPLASFVLAIRLLPTSNALPRRLCFTAAASITTLACFGALTAHGLRGITAMSHHAHNAQRSRVNLHAYMDGAGADAFEGKPGVEISYPHAERLRLLLDDATVRNMLPASIRQPLGSIVQCNGFEFPGVPESLPSMPDSLGTYTATTAGDGVGECVGRVGSTTWPYLLFSVAGYPEDPGIAFVVSGRAGTSVASAVPNADGRWRPLIVAAADVVGWTARDANVASWIAFSNPVEIGRLSMLTQQIAAKLRLPIIFD